MFETRLHGRGGQGVVTAAELLSIAAFAEGRHAQAFPSFGSERTGAPVISFCRIDDKTIRTREPINFPDAVIVVDPTLLHQVDVFGGLKPDGYILINSSRSLDELNLPDLAERFAPERICTVAATEISREHVGQPRPNVPMLGAFAAFTGMVALDAVTTAIRGRFPRQGRRGQRTRGGGCGCGRVAFQREGDIGGGGPCLSRSKAHRRSHRPSPHAGRR